MNATKPNTTNKMRAILVNWMVQVHRRLCLQPDTLFIAIEIVDRFLEIKTVHSGNLQLLGAVALMLAAKYGEVGPAPVDTLIGLATNQYPRAHVLRMERLVFAQIAFNVAFPTVYLFMTQALQVTGATTKGRYTARYIAELTLMEYRVLQYPPSLIGATCVFLAVQILANGAEQWTPALGEYSQWKLPAVEECAECLRAVCGAAPHPLRHAVRDKFSLPEYNEIAKIFPVLF